MTTREQVKDLRAGDVVELRYDNYPETVIRGPLHGSTNATLYVAFLVVRRADGYPGVGDSITVVSHAPRPLYVNHDRAEPVVGDVVRDADSDDAKVWIYYPLAIGRIGLSHPWTDPADKTGEHRTRDQIPDRLILLVDGQTGRCVP